MTPRIILVVRPNYDEATAIISKWAEDIIDYAQQRSLEVVDLHGSTANPNNFNEVMKKRKPSLIVHYGHGKYTYLRKPLTHGLNLYDFDSTY